MAGTKQGLVVRKPEIEISVDLGEVVQAELDLADKAVRVARVELQRRLEYQAKLQEAARNLPGF